ncbi:MAG: bifunctional riboflavin kinase/FAD synthetase [Cytophagales bacterium]|nr:bifunctional riboflavin kinase/FAD synthetase [Cytophagales bacterium]
MKIYSGIENFVKLPHAVVTSGTFDGVHIGHQKVLTRLNEIAKTCPEQREGTKGESVVITFWPHPRLVLFPEEKDLKLLSTLEEKQRILQNDIDHLIIINFSKKFAQLSSEDFIRDILVEKIGTKKLVIGYNHRFGKNREGDFEHLKANAAVYGFEIEEIPRQVIDNIAISSTKIRKALLAGDVKTARHYLNRPYSITGKVVRGDHLGRKLGFPTANIQLDEVTKLIPADGVYAVRVETQKNAQNAKSIEQRVERHALYAMRYALSGMMNIGHKPTVSGVNKTLEVNIFDFNNNIYGEQITISFIERIREERKFSDVSKLKEQLVKDKAEVLKRMASPTGGA